MWPSGIRGDTWLREGVLGSASRCPLPSGLMRRANALSPYAARGLERCVFSSSIIMSFAMSEELQLHEFEVRDRLPWCKADSSTCLLGRLHSSSPSSWGWWPTSRFQLCPTPVASLGFVQLGSFTPSTCSNRIGGCSCWRQPQPAAGLA